MESSNPTQEIQEGDLSDFIRTVFNNEPQDPNTIHLDLCLDSSDGETKEFLIFAQLIDIMCQGINIVFKTTEKININEITAKQLNILNTYFKSFGWEIVLERASANKHRISMKNIITNQFLPDCIYINS